jgi:hypothetical protein
MAHTCINEDRIRELELKEAVMGSKIENLIEKLNDLTNWIKVLIVTLLPVGLAGVGFLLVNWIKK